MPSIQANLVEAVRQYLSDLLQIKSTGATTPELSHYLPLGNLFGAVGSTMKPKVFCVGEMANQGDGRPDFGLFTVQQVHKGESKTGQKPERGVVEVKPIGDNTWKTASGDQVARYWQRYRQVLVTNARDFVLVGEDTAGQPVRLESFQLADSEEEFAARLAKPQAFANDVGPGLCEYLIRVMSHAALLSEPKDVAWLLAAYAREGLTRVEQAGDAPSLTALRDALEKSLGVRFKDEKGLAFFRSTLVQTLFYGVFSSWVLWARQTPPPSGAFDWRTAVWNLRTPVLQELFFHLSNPAPLQALGLVELLDWTATVLNRVDRTAFFDKFSESEAVAYFYEPFLQAFDPELRKQLGVWYTPPEIVRYMVARVDQALKEDLGIADGIAGENVFVLDPCCGTGAYLAEVLRRIAANLQSKGSAGLTGAQVKEAATKRVFGFEIMPAPFVVAHLQVGLTMQELDAPLSEDGDERAGVFLTNALTGWEEPAQNKLPFPELEQERERAERVKQDTPVLVILGNPPYNGFAGMAVDEESELSAAYRTTKQVQRPEGQGLNDLYVRFFRMAERRITEMTGQGVVCFISNYSWLDGLSFTGMRERFFEAFDAIRIDNLHGDRKISEYAPDGRTSQTVMAMRGQSSGIKVGTSIVLLSKKAAAGAAKKGVLYRDFHDAKAAERRQALLDSLAEQDIDSGYSKLELDFSLGLPFKPLAGSEGWQDWPALPDLFPTTFPGVKTSRDGFLVDIDLDRLKQRIVDYFDRDLSHEEIRQRYPACMNSNAQFDARQVRDALLQRGGPVADGFVRYAYRPLDSRWLYWEEDGLLLDRPRGDYEPHVFEGNWWLVSQQKPRRDWGALQVISNIGCLDLMDRGATCIPMWLRNDGLDMDGTGSPNRPNLSLKAQHYLEGVGATVEDLFYHVIATLHCPVYRSTNSGVLRMGWPRIPLPGWPDGVADGAADALAASVALGRQLAALLDPETPVTGVTAGDMRREFGVIAVPTNADGGNISDGDFSVSAGWAYFGTGRVVMPSQGQFVERGYTTDERAALGDAITTLGDTTFDVYLNDRAFWCNVPAAVWNYQLGGYQVLKKWLSYRESKVLGRPLQLGEAQQFIDTSRRIAAILGLVAST